MFDFLRDRGSTAEEKRLEALGAYLDDALTAAERVHLEGQLAADASMREELERLRVFKMQMRAMPRRRVPRSFALDPSLYARPKQQPLMQLYPVLRGATALTAFFLIFTLALGMFRGQFAGDVAGSAPQAATAGVVEEEAAAFSVAESAPQVATVVTNEEARVMATSAPETEAAPADLAAPAVITEAESAELSAPAEGAAAVEAEPAQTEMPETGLGAAAVPEEAADTAGDTLLAPAPSGAGVESSAIATDSEQAPSAVAHRSGIDAYLLPIQILLAILFVLLLVFWLIARRRARQFQRDG